MQPPRIWPVSGAEGGSCCPYTSRLPPLPSVCPSGFPGSIFLNDTACVHMCTLPGVWMPRSHGAWQRTCCVFSIQLSVLLIIPDKTFPHIRTGLSSLLHPGKSSCVLKVTSACGCLCVCRVGTSCSPQFLALQCLGLRQSKVHWTFHSKVFVSKLFSHLLQFLICFSFYLFLVVCFLSMK